MKKAIMILLTLSLFVTFVSADSGEEIKIQEVRYDEWALQYAVIREVNDFGLDRKVMCTDCTALATLQDNDGTEYFKDRSMKDMKNGLFGVQILKQDLPFEGVTKNVLFIVNVTSVQYGSSIVSSQLIVVNTQNPSVGWSWADATRCISDPASCIQSSSSGIMPTIDIKTGLLDFVNALSAPLMDPLRDMGFIAFFWSIVDVFYGSIEFILSGFFWAFSNLVSMMDNPSNYMRTIAWSNILYGIELFFIIYFAPLILIEGGILLYALFQNNGDIIKFMSVFISLNITAIGLIYKLVSFVVGTSISAFFMFLRLIKNIPVISHAWSSSD